MEELLLLSSCPARRAKYFAEKLFDQAPYGVTDDVLARWICEIFLTRQMHYEQEVDMWKGKYYTAIGADQAGNAAKSHPDDRRSTRGTAGAKASDVSSP